MILNHIAAIFQPWGRTICPQYEHCRRGAHPGGKTRRAAIFSLPRAVFASSPELRRSRFSLSHEGLASSITVVAYQASCVRRLFLSPPAGGRMLFQNVLNRDCRLRRRNSRLRRNGVNHATFLPQTICNLITSRIGVARICDVVAFYRVLSRIPVSEGMPW